MSFLKSICGKSPKKVESNVTPPVSAEPGKQKSYQWLVARGRIGLHRDQSDIHLELDPEQSAFCVLTVSDAREIGGITTALAREIWESAPQPDNGRANVEGTFSKACKLHLAEGVLEIALHDTSPLLSMRLNVGEACNLDVKCAVALVQILEGMSKIAEERQA